jgi:type II secretory ATPase GspE/PulE/Tfp pilus assembly ATPase PilB-like protein
VAIYEVLPMSSRVKEMLLVNSNSVEVRRAAVEEGMHSLRGASWIKVCQGVTTIDEMNRVTFED